MFVTYNCNNYFAEVHYTQLFDPVPSYNSWDRIQVSEEGDCSYQATLGIHEPAANSTILK